MIWNIDRPGGREGGREKERKIRFKLKEKTGKGESSKVIP
jgi:hypothetical protein